MPESAHFRKRFPAPPLLADLIHLKEARLGHIKSTMCLLSPENNQRGKINNIHINQAINDDIITDNCEM